MLYTHMYFFGKRERERESKLHWTRGSDHNYHQCGDGDPLLVISVLSARGTLSRRAHTFI